jgi:hypothetical protein
MKEGVPITIANSYESTYREREEQHSLEREKS